MIELYQRAQLLYQQHRYKEAEKYIKDYLQQNPNNVNAILLLIYIKMHFNDLNKAKNLINNALEIEADNPDIYYVKSDIAIREGKLKAAEFYIKNAINLNPLNSNYFACLSFINIYQKKYTEALENSKKALSLEPENLLALNSKSTALLKLNKHEESFKIIENALNEDPNNEYTHANYGWLLLEKGNNKKALEHFRESLKSDPNYVIAQDGMKLAIKANYIIYKLYLKYVFFLNNLTKKYQWFFIIGIYLLTQFLNSLAENNENLAPFLYPIVAILVIFALSTWLINPIGNLLLRFNNYGKYLLKNYEIINSNLVGISLLLSILSLIIYFITNNQGYLALFYLFLFLMIPFSNMFEEKKNFKIFAYTLLLIIIGFLSVISAFNTQNIYNSFTLPFIILLLIYQWIYNYITLKE